MSRIKEIEVSIGITVENKESTTNQMPEWCLRLM